METSSSMEAAANAFNMKHVLKFVLCVCSHNELINFILGTAVAINEMLRLVE